MPFVVAAGLVLVTSAAVLVLEVLANRLIAPYVGLSLSTYTAAIGVALAAISVGAAAGGLLADRWSPRRWIGPVTALGGLLVLLTRPAVLALGPSMERRGAVGIVVLAVAAVVPPALVLSTIPPAVVKLRLRDRQEAGRTVGLLSALGTAGALLGTFLTGFVLLGSLSSSRILACTSAVLVVVGTGYALSQRIDRRSGTALAALLALAVPATHQAVTADSRCQEETQYYCVNVVVDPTQASGRTLVLNGDQHSYVDLEDATVLRFPYVQRIAGVIGALPAGPVDVLSIGGGGFTLPRYIQEVRPGSSATVLEVDPGIVRVARTQLGLTLGPALEVVVGDGRTSIGRQQEGRFDVVIGDAFDRLAVPWHLTTVEMVQQVRRVLRPGGVYALNLIDQHDRRFLRAELATLRAVFAHVVVLACPSELAGRGPANFVLVAGDQPLDAVADEPLAVQGAGCYVPEQQVAALAADAAVLTDDDAPVEQLMSGFAYTR
jgi:spermidine synthase